MGEPSDIIENLIPFNNIPKGTWTPAGTEYDRLVEMKGHINAIAAAWNNIAAAGGSDNNKSVLVAGAYKELKDLKIKIVNLTDIKDPAALVFLGGSRKKRQSKKRKNHKKHNNNQ
jgi:hypothetical protein